MPSPKKNSSASPLPRMNPSSVSLADSLASSPPSSLYFNANSSTTTLQPPAEKSGATEKHKHYFLSRQKHRTKEKEDHHHLPLSSASSNSKPLDPHAPQSLYSFAPSSPGLRTHPMANSFRRPGISSASTNSRSSKRSIFSIASPAVRNASSISPRASRSIASFTAWHARPGREAGLR